MTHTCRRVGVLVLMVSFGASFGSGLAAQAPDRGPLLDSASRGMLQMLLTTEQLGGPEVSVGERTYPAGYESAEHQHDAIELIYVLSGAFHHVVNERTYVLGPGMLGVVKPGDTVIHRVAPGAPVKALVVWVPGSEGARIAGGWTDQP